MSKIWESPSPTACKLKWAWSTIFLNQKTTKSCFHNPVQTFDSETFNFHNITIKIEDRKKMLKGEWPQGCEYCSHTEELGGKSDRQCHNEIPELLPDSLDVNTSPKLLEVFFNNTCNMSCLYCGPGASSLWSQEIKKFGPIDINRKLGSPLSQDRAGYDKTIENFFIWFDKNKHTLERLNILGGEPFLLNETDRLLDVLSLEQHNLDLNIVSNLMIPTEIFDQYVEKLVKLKNNKSVKNIIIMASIDGWGPEVDVQRHGLDRNLWLRNFHQLLKYDEIKLDINVALTCLSIPALPKLIEMWNEWNLVKEVGLQGTRVFDPKFLSPEILPSKLNRPYFEEALRLINDNTWYKKWSKERFSNLLPIFDKYPEGNIEEMKKLKKYLNELEIRRSINWIDVFPTVYKELQNL